MTKQLGKGLGALLSDRSQPALDTSDKYKAIREKENVLEGLQEEIDTESKTLEDLRKRLTIELMLNGKVDKTELFKMEEALNEKVKKKDILDKEIESLKEEVRSYVKIDVPSDDKLGLNGEQGHDQENDLADEIDMRLVKELMPSSEEDIPEALEHDDEDHIQGLKDELDRNRQIEEVRREVYGDEKIPPSPASAGTVAKKKVRRVVSPRRVRVMRGTAKPISKRRDDRMYGMVEAALIQMKNGDNRGARAALEEVLQEYPNDDEVLYHIGNTYFMENDWEDAEALFRKVIERNPRSYRAFNNLGIVMQKLENKEAAIRAFNQSLEIQPDYEKAWMNLGVLFMEIEPPMLKEASIFLRRAIEIQPGLKKARIKLEECETMMDDGT
jgi:tetratricopeptide (TPR) repeat protein